MDERFDDALLSMLQETRTIHNFLDLIFSFLKRRTDFYLVTTNPNLGVGFGPGIAESIVKRSYFKYKTPAEPDCNEVPLPSIEEVVSTSLDTSNSQLNRFDVKTSPDITFKEEKSKFTDTYNGAVYEHYAWSQTITDLTVQFKLDTANINVKNLTVDISSTNVSIRSKTCDAVYLEGELCHKCKPQETIWSVDGDIINIYLEKAAEIWWNCFLKSEPKLDLRSIDCSRPFEELSEEAQAKIAELKWNQERKQQGLKTTDEMKVEKMLQQAWNAEGSPFSGDFDPSKVKLSGGSFS